MRTPDLEGTLQWYVDTALVRLLAKADELVESGGDELLSRCPDVEGANPRPRRPHRRPAHGTLTPFVLQ